MSTGDKHMRCPMCGLPYYYQPSDTGGYGFQNLCQCNQHLTLPNTGWTCPKCGNVYSPDVKECANCNSKFRFTYTTETNT